MTARTAFGRNMRYGALFVFTLLVAVAGNLASTPKAYAWPFTLGEHRGFFEHRTDNYGGSVIQEGINPGHSAAYNINNFVNDINAALYRRAPKATSHNAVGAAFIILTMLGHRQSEYGRANSADRAINDARDVFGTWEALVRSYATAGRVNFNTNYTYTRNTYWMTGATGNDVAWYTPGTETERVVLFTAPNGAQYAIKHDCGNPVGNMQALPSLWAMDGFVRISTPSIPARDAHAGSPTQTIDVIPGTTVTVQYFLRNATTTSTAPTSIWWDGRGNVNGGAMTTIFPGANSGTYAGSQTKSLRSEPINVADPVGTTRCRWMGFQPTSASNGALTQTGRVCYRVVAPPIWQLNGTSTVAPNAVRPGSPVNFTHVIRNTGSINTGAWTWRLYFSTPAGAITGNVPASAGCSPVNGNGPVLAPGGTYSRPCAYTIPASAASGSQVCMVIGYTPANNQVPPSVNQHSAPACVTVHGQITVSCSLSTTNLTSPGNPPEEGSNVRGTITITQSPMAFPVAPPHNLQYTVTGPGTNINGNVGAMSATFNVNNASAGLYTVVARFVGGPAGGLDSVPLTNFNPCGTFTVYRLPYLRVYNGDAQAGAHFRTAGACGSSASTARIQAFNRGAGNGGLGSGAQIAALAGGQIDGFVSSSIRAPAGLRVLTFANTGAGAYGGNYGYGPCIPDYWAPVTNGQTTAYGAMTTAGNNVNTHIVGGGANFSGKQDIFVNGDAYISGSIVYAGAAGTWTRTTVPYFRLIVRGNIYIAPSVSQLDGVYVAIPTNANNGLIYTCATSNGAGINTAFVANGCANKLTVNGAFIAQGVKFLRTTNTLANAAAGQDSAPATSRAAEVFVFSPEAWVTTPQYTTPTSQQTYDALTSLPPVL